MIEPVLDETVGTEAERVAYRQGFADAQRLPISDEMVARFVRYCDGFVRAEWQLVLARAALEAALGEKP